MRMDNFSGQQFPELELPRATNEEIEWRVNFSATNFSYVSDWTCEELERITRYQSNVELPTKEELEKYFATLLYARVSISQGHRMAGNLKPSFLRRIFVPARFAALLAMIGEVVYTDVNIRIKPETSVTDSDIYNDEELMQVSNKLERFFPDGFCGTMGFSMDRYGDAHFMNKVCIIEGKPQEVIKSITKDNPLYGFMSWIMNSELLEVAYQEAKYLLRVNYSAPTVYKSIARRVWTNYSPTESRDKNNENPYQNQDYKLYGGNDQ